jgi:DnaK suppressor protein
MSHEALSKKKLEVIRKDLEARKFELEEEMIGSYQEKFSDDQVQDSADEALASTMESLKASLHDNKNVEYKRVIQALEMINEGSYGVCVDCGKAISDKRLKYYPNATRCLLCQETFEEQDDLEQQ